MIVAVLDPIHPEAMSRLAQRCDVIGWDDPRAGAWAEMAHGVIVRIRCVSEAELQAARQLKVVGKHGVGVDNIDLGAARRLGVRVVHTPGANAQGVAELTAGLALALARRIALADRTLRAGGKLDRDGLWGTELYGKRLGVVGLGQIGRRVAELFRAAFSMEVWGYDPYLAAPEWERIGVRRVSFLDELLPVVDVLTLHLPLTPRTRGLIGRRELALMRPSAFVLNLARGGIVDEQALYEALRSGRLAGAASDVFEQEPPPADHPLLTLPQFVATPHVGAATAESMLRMGMAVVEEVLAVLEGREPRHPVV
ncbi:MAG: hydroxyacid dehydrogenase [Bacillota bacterium]